MIVWCPFILAEKIYFSISSWPGLLVTISFSFCSSATILIFPLFLMQCFAGYRNLGWNLFTFSTLIFYLTTFWPLWFLMNSQLLILLKLLCVFHLLFSKSSHFPWILSVLLISLGMVIFDLIIFGNLLKIMGIQINGFHLLWKF